MALSSSQKKLIGSFFLIVVLSGILFLGVHYLLYLVHLAPSSILIYMPFILLGAIVVYVLYLRAKVKAVQFRGTGTSVVPAVYFVVMLLAPVPFLHFISIVTDQVVEISSVEQWPALEDKSFVRIAALHPRPDELIDTVVFNTFTDDNDLIKTNYQYTALVPLTTQKNPAWIVFRHFETLDGNLPTAAIVEKQKTVSEQNRKRNNTYPYDSIQYFTEALTDHPIALLKSKNKSSDQAIFLQPSLESASDFRSTWIWISGILLLILCFYFVFSVVFGHNEQLDID
jgi:hypothetical protein